jgi:hypothetical protein
MVVRVAIDSVESAGSLFGRGGINIGNRDQVNFRHRKSQGMSVNLSHPSRAYQADSSFHGILSSKRSGHDLRAGSAACQAEAIFCGLRTPS